MVRVSRSEYPIHAIRALSGGYCPYHPTTDKHYNLHALAPPIKNIITQIMLQCKKIYRSHTRHGVSRTLAIDSLADARQLLATQPVHQAIAAEDGFHGDEIMRVFPHRADERRRRAQRMSAHRRQHMFDIFGRANRD